MANQRFYSLDAMRGVAALAIVFFHIGMALQPPFFRLGYLAVDFFFVLSGFVLARSYEQRFAQGMSAPQFMWIRVVRFFPLFALGSALGLVMVLGQIYQHATGALNPGAVIPSFGLNILMLPAITSAGGPFPFDPPQWSLFFELVINGLFATVLFRLRSAFVLIVAAILGVIYLYFGLYTLGSGIIGAGWSQMWLAFCRVGFSFPLGMVLARAFTSSNRTTSLWGLLPIGLLASLLLMPAPNHQHWLFDAFCIYCFMGVIVWLGATLELPTALKPIAAFLGDVSFPLYAIHYPLLRIFFYATTRLFHIPVLVTGPAYLCLMLALSWVLAHHFDGPARRWLIEKSHSRGVAISPS